MRERIYSDGMMNKQTRVFNFQCFSLWHYPFLAWDFLGLNFWSGIFGVLLEALGIFLGLDFWLHSSIPVT